MSRVTGMAPTHQRSSGRRPRISQRPIATAMKMSRVMNLRCQTSSVTTTHARVQLWQLNRSVQSGHSHHHSDQERVLEPGHTEEVGRIGEHDCRPAQGLCGDTDSARDRPAEVRALEDLGPGRSLSSAVVLPLSLDGVSDSGVFVVLRKSQRRPGPDFGRYDRSVYEYRIVLRDTTRLGLTTS